MAFNKMLVCAALLLAVCYVRAAPADAPSEAPADAQPKEILKRSPSLGYGYALTPSYYGGWYPYSGGLDYGSSLYSYGYPSYYSGYSGYGGYGGLGHGGLGYGSTYGYGYGYPHGYSSYGW